MSMHQSAINCLDRAEKLVADGSRESLRYASLELRLSIEEWFYDVRKQYLSHLPEKLYETWQPHQLMKAILQIDPEALEDRVITFFPDEKISFTGAMFQLRGLKPKEIRKHHNSLGKYLHADLDRKRLDEAKWRSELQDAIDLLCRLRDANAIVTGFNWIDFQCECGLGIRRAKAALQEGLIIECVKEECQKQYIVSLVGDDFHVKPDRCEAECPKCNKAIFFNRGSLRPDTGIIQCHECRAGLKLVPMFMVQTAKPQSQADN